jgi:hypothetical protein
MTQDFDISTLLCNACAAGLAAWLAEGGPDHSEPSVFLEGLLITGATLEPFCPWCQGRLRAYEA